MSNDGDEPVQMERLTVVRKPAAVQSSMDLKSSFRNKTQDKRMQVKFVDFKLPDHSQTIKQQGEDHDQREWPRMA